MIFINKHINKLFIFILIIISLYNISSILVITFSAKIDDYYSKIINYLPYNYTIFFIKPLMYKKKDIQVNNEESKKLYKFLNQTEKKSALDYKYWETKIFYQINNSDRLDFEKNFINLFILSKNNEKKNRSLKLYYLRNIPRFSKEVGDIVMTSK
tara:strand:- start:655 stop:1119 length:465 start_codon:yes stop_codon:yes gene_type:complete